MDLDLSHLWTQEGWRKKHQDTDILWASTTHENKVTKGKSVFEAGLATEGRYLTSEGILSENDGFETQKTSKNEGQTFQNKRSFGVISMWCLFLAWALCLLTSLLCLGLSAALGSRFSNNQVLLWIQSLFVSLISCLFFIQPALIFAAAVVVSLWNKKAPFPLSSTSIREETLNSWSPRQPEDRVRASGFPEQRTSDFAKLLGARRRARHLRLAHPPPPAELRRTRSKRRREALIHKTLRDLCFCTAMLLLMSCVAHYSSFKEDYQLNRAVKRHFIGRHGFMAIKTQEDWWKWTQTTLLDLLEQIQSEKTDVRKTSHVQIGGVVIKKTERCRPAQNQVALLRHLWTSDGSSCRSEEVLSVVLGHARSDAETELNLLRSSGWLDRRTVALKVHFTLYGLKPNLFTSVTLLAEQSPSGVLRPSAKVQLVQVDPTPFGGDCVVMVCQLLFLLLSLLRLSGQVSTAAQQGLMGHWRTPSTCLDVGLLTATLVYHVSCVRRSVAMAEAVGFLQDHGNKRPVDVSDLSTREQYIRSLHGIILFLLTIKAVTVLGVNRTFSLSAAIFARSLCSLFSPPCSGLALLALSSCLGNLLCVQSFGVFSSLWALLCNYRGLRATRGLSGPDFALCDLLLLSASVVWTAVVIGAISSSIRAARRPQIRKKVLTTAEMFSYVKKKVSELIGRHRQTGMDHQEEDRTLWLEELEISVEELLVRLSALSDITNHPLLPKTPNSRNKDFPTPQNSDTEDSLRSQTTLKESDQRPASRLLRPHDIQKVLDQRRKTRNYHPDFSEEPIDELRNKNCSCCTKSTSVKELLAEDTQSSCSFSKIHSEVVVEVLVHKEQGTEESGVFN